MVREGFPVLPPVYFPVLVKSRVTSPALFCLVQEIPVTIGEPVTEHVIVWLFPWKTKAVGGDIATFNRAGKKYTLLKYNILFNFHILDLSKHQTQFFKYLLHVFPTKIKY